jgi:4-carboxymuconolactone decarboxylase
MSQEQNHEPVETSLPALRARGMELMDQLTADGEGMAARIGALSPDYLGWVTDFALATVWDRPGLDLKTRSLCTVAALCVLGRLNHLRTHIRGALANGATREEVVEVLHHMTVYGGFPDAWDGLAVARDVFAALDSGEMP